jgi:glycosyltransferase involved in cell wall biosynthesis
MHVCWLGNHRYTQPLNPTDEKKWRLLSGLNVEIDVVAFSAGIRPRLFTQHAHFYLLPELPTAILRYAEMFLLTPILLLWLIFRHETQIIIAQSPFEGAIGALAKNVARAFGRQAKLVIESHGDFEGSLFKQRQITLSDLYRRLMNASAGYAFRHADALRAVSSTTRAQLERWSPGKPLEQFITWTDFSIFSETHREKKPSQTHNVIYAGVLTPLKAVHVLIEAFGRVQIDFPDAHLDVVGKAEDRNYATELERRVSWQNLESKVHFLGAVNQRDLAQRIAKARVLVLPSTTEGLPRVLVEAMLCGTPVIATNVGGIPDIMQEGINGYLIPSNDVDALTERLRSVLGDPEIDLMAEGARAFAERFFSENAYVEGYRRLIEAATNSHSLTPLPLQKESEHTKTGAWDGR